MSDQEKGIFNLLYGFFRSIKLTIFLLILLAILSIIGTIIQQNEAPSEYLQRYGTGLYNVLDFFSLFDMYHSWWFSTILLFLVINLIACSINRFPGTWRQIFHRSDSKVLKDSMIKTLPYLERVDISNLKEILNEHEISSILKKGIRSPDRVETDSAITFYSEKGRFSRFGVYLTHLSIIIILIGGLIGSLYGFRGFVNILEGESVDQIYLKVKGEEISKPVGFSIRCDEFKITYYDLSGKDRYVKEYASDLTVIEDGREILKKTITVNNPLHYKGLNFYQASYGAIHDVAIGVKWKMKKDKDLLRFSEGGTISIPNSPFLLRMLRYENQIHNFGEGVQLLLLKPNQEPKALWLLKNFPQMDESRGDEFVLTLEEVIEKEYTGLQVTKDPGVGIVWIGCGMMVLGLLVSFFSSHQRIWIRIPKGGGEIILAGSTNKNRVGFEKRFRNLVEDIQKRIK